MTTLLEAYQASVAEGLLRDDVEQRKVILKLQAILDAVLAPRHWWQCFRQPIQGLYLYGHVGVGKTYLLNLFYHAVPEERRARYHFHHFMQEVDSQLRQLQGVRNPLERIAADLAKQVNVLCLDEFLVNDVADASILALLLKALFRKGVVMVATANTAPKDLYLYGVHRERFLPAIALIEKQCEVYELPHHADYRLGLGTRVDAYITPLNKHTEKKLATQFEILEPFAEASGILTVQRREISFVRCGKCAIWFEFSVICHIPRSQLDYLELASRFDIFFVSGVPVFKPEDTVAVLLFMYWVDVMYDERKRLILSAEVTLDALYPSGSLVKGFERTKSRLVEMQSVAYCSGPRNYI